MTIIFRHACPMRSDASHASLPSVVVHHATPPQAMTACVGALDASRSEDHDPHQDHWLLTRLRRTMTPVRPWRYTRLRSRWCARNSGSNVATTRCNVQHSGVWLAHMARGTVSCACMQCGLLAGIARAFVHCGTTATCLQTVSCNANGGAGCSVRQPSASGVLMHAKHAHW